MQGRKLSFPFTEQLVCRGVMGKCPLGFRSHATGGEMGGQGPLVILGPMFRLTNVQDCRPRPKLSCKSPTTDKCLNPDTMACAAARSVPRPPEVHSAPVAWQDTWRCQCSQVLRGPHFRHVLGLRPCPDIPFHKHRTTPGCSSLMPSHPFCVPLFYSFRVFLHKFKLLF